MGEVESLAGRRSYEVFGERNIFLVTSCGSVKVILFSVCRTWCHVTLKISLEGVGCNAVKFKHCVHHQR